MVDIATVRTSLSQVAQSTRVAMRCLNGGRDSHDASLRALSLLVDILDLLYRIKDEISWTEEQWFVAAGRLRALSELLGWFGLSMKSIELYFQPGGVGVFYFRKHLLEKTYVPRLEQYKIMFLLAMQPDSEYERSSRVPGVIFQSVRANVFSRERSLLDKEVRNKLKSYRDVEAASLKLDLQFEEDALGLTSRLSMDHFITLADLCHRRQKGTYSNLFSAGAGKTFLSSSVIDSLQRTFPSFDVATVFIFCQEENGKERTSMDLLKSILAQLVYCKRSLSYATSSLYYSESLAKGSASPKAYQNAIRAEVNRFSKVFFVVDGLDMFPDKERILSRLHKLPDQAQLLVTLREMSDVKAVDNSGYVSVFAPPEDIGLYTLARTRADHGMRCILGDTSPDLKLEDAILHSVVARSHGLFLLAKLHLDLLSQYMDRSLLERALMHLPESLGEAYGEAMKQVVSQSSCATRYVYWTLYALRPLSVSELRSAVKDNEKTDNPESVPFEHSLQVQSAGLLTIDAVSGTVCFVHRTAKEYLNGSAARVFFPGAQKDIAEVCLSVITPDEVIDECYLTEPGTSRASKKGFLDYAATYWGFHAREIPEDEQTIQVLIKTFLNKLLWRRPPLDFAIGKENGIPSQLGIGKYPTDWSGLHVLGFFGISVKAKRLLEQGENINAQENSMSMTPLHCAASQGNDEMVEFLLENGANGNAVTADGQTALHLATQNGHRKCMKVLCSRRVDTQIVDENGATSLLAAVGTATDESTVPLLVRNKADVNFQNLKTGNTALHLAVEWRRPRIILFLLEKRAAIDITNNEGLTPLQLAATLDYCEAITLLLQQCAHVEARSLAGPTALQYAAWRGHWVAFDLLLIGGADINAWNKRGETLLHEQARYVSNISIASKLLEQGANIEARTSQGYTPLQCAAMTGNKTMFQLLLAKGAKVDIETAKGETLLHITPPANEDCLEILTTVLKAGISVTATSSQGWTALHQTVYTGTGALNLASDKTAEYISLLLDHGASVNEVSGSSQVETPLHLAAMAPLSRASLVGFLIEQGSNINAVTGEGKTALHLAAERGREPILRLLLDAGADLTLKIPTHQSVVVTEGENKETPITAIDLAKKNPFGVLLFDDEGKLRPKPQRSRPNSASTIIEDMDSEVYDSETGESTLVGSEHPYVVV
ncbi:hypothetical protein NUU61_005250 [Penicillium alfredii]|uniref:NACHT domain-containing protein n=1 Tax=Penicillium alfredii TaxID=1506179 RepID=A0A9W9K7F5_9EURO|nr:uncharacterized protein NUU61_005250 [Penicillium alfredii]KAJ5095894.1 hypothetical protein NUU61_005250 [Penicillium alfredii]